MSLLLDALKKAELENEIQSIEENGNKDTAESKDIESNDVAAGGASDLSITADGQATQNENAALQHVQENKHAVNDSQANVLPSMSFIKDKKESPESSNSTALSLEPKHSKPAKAAVTITTSQNQSTSLDESTISTLAMQGDENQSGTIPIAQPYRPKPNFAKPWFATVSALSLIVIGSTGAYYFFERLNEISQESNLSRAIPDTSIQDDIANLDTTSPTTTDKIEQSIPSNLKLNSVPLVQAKADNIATLKPAIKSRQNKPVKKRAETLIQTTIDNVRSRPPVKIIKKSRINPLQELLQLAYRAYVNDNYTEANKLYKEALSFKENNRDALIGLAIIAHRSKQPNTARRYYNIILSLNPKDSQAASGLIALMQGSNPTASESRLKIMLENEPQAAHLHFTLGNQYVKQGRWADAQQAFFQAYHAQPENADYTMNLAVSLDQIKQPRAALKYYRLALKLAKGKNVSFNVLDIAARVRTITKDITQ